MADRISRGSATILAGDTYATVTHGLEDTPDIDDIGLTSQDDLSGRTCFVSNITATTFRINISDEDPFQDHTIGYLAIYETSEPSGLGVAVTCDKVRARINVDSSEIADVYVADFIDDATSEVEGVTGETIDHMDPTALESTAITNLAALFCYAHLKSGGPAKVTYTAPGVMAFQNLDPTIDLLQKSYDRAIKRLEGVGFKVAESRVTTDDQLWE